MTTFPALDAIAFDNLIQKLDSGERGSRVEVLLALAEFEQRKLHLELGYDSLWGYCTKALHYDEGETYLRTRSCHLLRTFPKLADALRDRRLSMTTMVELGKVLTPENFDDLFERAAGLSKMQMQQLVASIRPTEVLFQGFRAVPSPPAPDPIIAGEPAPGPAPISARPPKVKPVSAKTFRFTAEFSEDTMDAVKEARELASNRIPPQDWDRLFREMARVFIDHERKRLTKQTDRPRTALRPKSNRAIPAATTRAMGDDVRCSYVGPTGIRCNSRWKPTRDHKDPVARGGASVPDRMRWLCANHNQLEADHAYGREFMDAKRVTQAGKGTPEAPDH